jgi:nucleoid-associated protein YgaU
MGLIDFVKDAGAKLLGRDTQADRDEENRQAAAALTRVVTEMGMKVQGLGVTYNEGVATVRGTTPSQEDREKVVLLIGNTHGVSQVDDQLQVEKPEPQATLYTVKSGDSLSKIAKTHYGDAMKYPVVFQANTPMLKDPDKIYPGQVLRIPPLG